MKPTLENLQTKDEIIEVVTKLFIAVDNKDWEEAKSLFHSTVLFDMTSAGEPQAVSLTPVQIVDSWEKGLQNISSLHHQAGNFIVELKNNEADLFCYGIAIHYNVNPNGNTRTFVGSYQYHLIKTVDQWKIDKFKFNLKFMDGNLNL